jgi:hypothetical protein
MHTISRLEDSMFTNKPWLTALGRARDSAQPNWGIGKAITTWAMPNANNAA